MFIRFLITAFLLLSFIQCKAEDPAKASNLDDPIEALLINLYDSWNKHDLDKLNSLYHKDFKTGDGINRESYKELTKSLWDSYPDIKIENQKKTIRSQDQYATVSLIDFYLGESKEMNPDLNQNGTLNAISQGQIFLQKFGQEWKIVSDKVQFELVTVYYGNAKEYLDNHQIYFSSPEQVKSEEQYSATLYFILPENIRATASINKDLIEKPDPDKELDESFQVINEHKLEKLFKANDSNHNELVSATVVISKGIIEPKLDGILYISKRINVLPQLKANKEEAVVKTPFSKIYKEEKPKEEKKTDNNSEANAKNK
jgi:hypothetical protein